MTAQPLPGGLMTVTAPTRTTIAGLSWGVLARTLEEGYGAGAWHGPDLESALADVTERTAFVRPAAGRHNIAEIALHHAWYVRSVTSRLTGRDPDTFLLEGEDWFDVDASTGPDWQKIAVELASRQKALTAAVDDLAAGRARSPLSEAERFDVVLGITCHAIYHAGQIQLIKRLLSP